MTADPKAAEREAAAREMAHRFFCMTCPMLRPVQAAHSEECDMLTGAVLDLLTTRERDAAAGALREAEETVRSALTAGLLTAGNVTTVCRQLERRRLALEQGTPATCASCGKPMEGERFTVQASVRADLVGKTVGRCCWPPDHGAPGTPATREETP